MDRFIYSYIHSLIYTLVKSFNNYNFFIMYLKDVFHAHQGCIHLITSTVKTANIVKYYYNLK